MCVQIAVDTLSCGGEHTPVHANLCAKRVLQTPGCICGKQVGFKEGTTSNTQNAEQKGYKEYKVPIV